MQDSKQEIIAILKKANNVLVTVKKDPSVDELSAALGLTLALNKIGKHAAAVYSGQTPSTIEFLQPEDTFEKTTDSLRDFIISLDKAKADKLKYKVEDDVVKIFITPYRASISENDLEFSQGDFNVEAVVALGVKEQLDLDEAIRAHGRIFHDAKVITINNSEGADIGGISLVDVAASGMSELTADVARELGENVLDEQVATAFLTGIVASTDRFSNERTSANTMKTSAVLMAAGANQQLVATKLTVAPAVVDLPDEITDQSSSSDDGDGVPDVDIADDGSLKITHQGGSDDHKDETKGEEHSAPETPDQPAEESTNPALAPVSESINDMAELQLPPALDSNDTPDESEPSPIERSFVGTPGGEDAHLRQGAGESATSTLDYEAAPSEPAPADALPPSLPASTPASAKKVIQPLGNENKPKEPLPAVPSTLEDIERAVHSNHVTAQKSDLRPGENTEEHSELDLSMLQTPMGLTPDQGTPLPPPANPGAAPPVPPPIIPPTP